jgi:hypothetical protein
VDVTIWFSQPGGKQMRLIKKLLVVSAAAMLLSACASYVNHDELRQLHSGMSPRAVAHVLSSSPEENMEMRVHGHHVLVQVFGSGRGTYLIAYRNNRLFHKGTLDNFMSSGNRLVRAIGRRANADMGASSY